MTHQLDVEGPAAPPRLNGELTFDEPWQSRVFATTMAACDAGVIEYETFRERLIDQITRRDADTATQLTGDDDQDADRSGADDYWAAWQDAFESLAFDLGVVDDDELGARAEAFAEHP